MNHRCGGYKVRLEGILICKEVLSQTLSDAKLRQCRRNLVVDDATHSTLERVGLNVAILEDARLEDAAGTLKYLGENLADTELRLLYEDVVRLVHDEAEPAEVAICGKEGAAGKFL